MNQVLNMDDGVDMKIMKIGYVLLIGIAAFLALPAHGAESDSEALRKCILVDEEMTIHYNCEEPATVAFCYEDIVMKPNAAEIEIKLAKGLLCRSGDGFHDPCHFFGPGKCHNIEMQAWANRIAGYTVVYGVCPDVGNSPEWVSNPGSNGQYTCDPDPMEGIGSDDGSDGGAETLSEDDLYERLFGEYENTLSMLLDGDLSSDEILGILLVELLGGDLSFDDALGNIGKGQTESSDQGKEQVASGDQEGKQSSLSASSAACKEYLDTVYDWLRSFYLGSNIMGTNFDKDLSDVARSFGFGGDIDSDHVFWLARDAATLTLHAIATEERERGNDFPNSLQHWEDVVEEVAIPAFLEHVGVCIAP